MNIIKIEFEYIYDENLSLVTFDPKNLFVRQERRTGTQQNVNYKGREGRF